MKRHHVELAYRTGGTISARCRCGWEGTAYQLRDIGRTQAIRAAEHDAAEHEAEQEQ
ncbi:MAG: hypothetical protein ACRDYA_25320 [Egibacteraceae bacterium]